MSSPWIRLYSCVTSAIFPPSTQRFGQPEISHTLDASQGCVYKCICDCPVWVIFLMLPCPAKVNWIAWSECSDNTTYQSQHSGPAQMTTTTTVELHEARYDRYGRASSWKDPSIDEALCLHSGKMKCVTTHLSIYIFFFFQLLTWLVTIVNLWTCKYVKQPEL